MQGRERRRQGETWGERDRRIGERQRHRGERKTGEAEAEGEKDAGREPQRMTKNQQTEGTGRGKTTFRHTDNGKGQ